MSKKLCFLAGSCGLMLIALCTVTARAQSSEVKEKAPMYSYIANWQIPRAHWGDMAKANAGDKPILDKALADGTIVGYGSDESLVHQAKGYTHDNWWSSMSMAGLMKVLDQFMTGGSTSPDVTTTATSHEDLIFESRYYNWKSGAFKNGYVEVSKYKLKADAPDDALDTLSKNLIAPLLEKMLAEGSIVEYEIDTQAVHTEAPGNFWIVYVASNPEGLDKVNGAILNTLKTSPLSGPAFDSMVDYTTHRDELMKGEGVFK